MIGEQVKLQALKLRAQGISINEISRNLNVSQSTVSLLVRNLKLSKNAKDILLEKRKQGRAKATQVLMDRRIKRQENAVGFAEKLLDKVFINKDISFLIASISYECEGGKSNFGVLEFTNSDPVLVKIFLTSLRKSFAIDENKFRVMMHLHSYHVESVEKSFWSKVTGIPEEKFLKTFKKQESGINKKENYRGCVQIKYFDVSIKRTLLASKLILAKKMGL